MIQRLQTIYLLIVGLLSIFGSIFIPDLHSEGRSLMIPYDEDYVNYGYLVITAVAFISILLFKSRKNQMTLVKIGIILNIILLGFLVYWFLSLPGENDFSKKGIGMLFPVVSIVFLFLAHKAIKKDDKLVKSVSRFR